MNHIPDKELSERSEETFMLLRLLLSINNMYEISKSDPRGGE